MARPKFRLAGPVDTASEEESVDQEEITPSCSPPHTPNIGPGSNADTEGDEATHAKTHLCRMDMAHMRPRSGRHEALHHVRGLNGRMTPEVPDIHMPT